MKSAVFRPLNEPRRHQNKDSSPGQGRPSGAVFIPRPATSADAGSILGRWIKRNAFGLPPPSRLPFPLGSFRFMCLYIYWYLCFQPPPSPRPAALGGKPTLVQRRGSSHSFTLWSHNAAAYRHSATYNVRLVKFSFRYRRSCDYFHLAVETEISLN